MFFRIEKNELYEFFETTNWALKHNNELDMSVIIFNGDGTEYAHREFGSVFVDGTSTDVVVAARTDIIALEFDRVVKGKNVYKIDSVWWSQKYKTHKQNNIDDFVDMHYTLPMGVVDSLDEANTIIDSVKTLLKDWENRE